MIYCNDVDLMHWEPNIFRDASAVGQTLMSGTGDLAGTTFTISSGSLAQIAAGSALVIDGSVNQTLSILAVTSDTVMTVSVLWGDDQTAVDSKGASGVAYSIPTLSAQSKLISDILAEMIAEEGTVLNPEVLRRPTALGTLMLVYRALGASATTTTSANLLTARADLYERLYKRAIRAVTIEIDTDGDGVANVKRDLGVAQLNRA